MIKFLKRRKDILDYNSGKMTVLEVIEKHNKGGKALFLEVSEKTKKELSEILELDIGSILEKPIIFLESGKDMLGDETCTFYLGEIYTERGRFRFSYAFNNNHYLGVTLKKVEMLREIKGLQKGTLSWQDSKIISKMLEEKKRKEGIETKEKQEKYMIEEIQKNRTI